MTPPRVLLSAYQCGPGKGSVSQIGWEWYSRLVKKGLPITLITHSRNRDELLEAGAPLADSEIIFIDTEWFAKPLYNFASKLFPSDEDSIFFISSVDFYLYDWRAIKQLKQHHKAGKEWDIIHVVTPVSPMAATRLHFFNRPVILGPWNGGLKYPVAFPEIKKQEYGWLHSIRHLGRIVDWVVRSTQKASIILTATQATRQTIPVSCHPRCRFLLENGVNLELFRPIPWPTPPSPTQALQIVFVGRFQAFKGLPMLLEAIARLHFKENRPVKLTIVGEGPLREKWEQEANSLQINHLINWTGNLPLAQVVEQLHAAHILCLPSVRESGGAVLIEAMACARPVLTVKYGGPGELVDDQVGQAIPPEGGASGVIAGMVEAFSDIFEHPEVWRQRGINGRLRSEQLYSWDAKIEQGIALYQELMTTH
jgi:glycosyltransferase involved in cell wall biosynthesis